MASVTGVSPFSHSRMPRSGAPGAPLLSTACLRVAGRVIENAWVGPPMTTRSKPSSASGAASMLTTSVGIRDLSASAMARASFSVFPHRDS